MDIQSATNELLNSAQFHPVFGPNGEIEGISQLKVATDRRIGMRAVEDLVSTYEKGDEAVLNNGWTAKQMRILNSAAPTAAHYLKPTKKYDAVSGEMVPAISIIIPYEVSWRLFELLFDGQYSVQVEKITTETEDVLAATFRESESGDKKTDDAPGRIFYTRAEVCITLHLQGGIDRKFTGVGVAFDTVRQHKAGNVFAINSARRTADKGAISDAKREAVATIGRVFRRAFEDGDQMIQKFEDMLLIKLREHNKANTPSAARASDAKAEKVAAPKSRNQPKDAPKNEGAKTIAQDKPTEVDDSIPYDDFSSKDDGYVQYSIYFQGQMLDQTDDPDIYFDRMADALSNAKDSKEIEQILAENKSDLNDAEKSSKNGNTVSELSKLATESEQDSEAKSDTKKKVKKLPPKKESKTSESKDETEKAKVTDNEDQDDESLILKVERKTGSAILSAYEKKFKSAKSKTEIENILQANTGLARRLTTAQKGKLLKLTLEAKNSK